MNSEKSVATTGKTGSPAASVTKKVKKARPAWVIADFANCGLVCHTSRASRRGQEIIWGASSELSNSLWGSWVFATIRKNHTQSWGWNVKSTMHDTMAVDDEQRVEKFARCDDAYYKNTEPIAERLFAFIKANKVEIRL